MGVVVIEVIVVVATPPPPELEPEVPCPDHFRGVLAWWYHSAGDRGCWKEKRETYHSWTRDSIIMEIRINVNYIARFRPRNKTRYGDQRPRCP